MSSTPIRELSGSHRDKLHAAAITDDAIAARGVYSVHSADALPEELSCFRSVANCVPAMVMTWVTHDGRRVPRLYPDTPLELEAGSAKYVSPPDSGQPIDQLLETGDNGSILFVEGTKQSLAALSHAPAGFSVYGLVSCTGLGNDPLGFVNGRDCFILLDGDVKTNLDVWNGGDRGAERLRDHGAASVKFVLLPVGDKKGLDDYLATVAPADRKMVLTNRVKSAVSRLPGKPKHKSHPFFDGGSLRAQKLADSIRETEALGVMEDDRVAVYTNGTYGVSDWTLRAAVKDRLGDLYRPGHVDTISEVIHTDLMRSGQPRLAAPSEPFLNCTNGMVDLRTGELLAHDPRFRSINQIPVAYDPNSGCPNYLAWCTSVGIADQLDDLEESVAQMLDESSVPAHTVFLYGPSRTGKSTFLRIMSAMVGEENKSSVSLHQLAENTFMAANVYGKMLNVSADLSARALGDISQFKMLTGGDSIQADRKYGQQFSWTPRTMFAFSANTLPPVPEASSAYTNRVKPFKFDVTFEGREDPSIEANLMSELPGILTRWVLAYRRRAARGCALPSREDVRREFAEKSDRVTLFVSECCVIEPVDTKTGDTARSLYRAFKDWALDSGFGSMSEGSFKDRLRKIPGVTFDATNSRNTRTTNLRRKTDDDVTQTHANSEAPATSLPAETQTTQTQGHSQFTEMKTDTPPASETSDNGSEFAEFAYSQVRGGVVGEEFACARDEFASDPAPRFRPFERVTVPYRDAMSPDDFDAWFRSQRWDVSSSN